MTKTLVQVAVVVGLFLSFLASAEATPAHVISAAQIETMVEKSGLALSLARYRLLLPRVVGKVESPQLRVESQSVRGSALGLRVACESHQCLPFYVELDFASSQEAEQAARTLVVSATARRIGRRRPALVHGGSLAKLEIVISRDVKLHFYVRCLQSGAAGEMVRVRDEKMRRNYLAQVTDAGELRTQL